MYMPQLWGNKTDAIPVTMWDKCVVGNMQGWHVS